jgi:septal ring factor EnvC (AmiA/AmiB activator)
MMLAVVLSGQAPAEDRDERAVADQIQREQETLQKLKDEIAEGKKQVGEAERKRESVLQGIQDLDARLMMSRQRRHRVNRQLKQKDEELEAITNQLDAVRGRIRERRASIVARVRVQYMLGRLGYLKPLLSAEDPSDFHRRFQYLSAISKREYELLDAYREDVASLEAIERKRGEARDQMLVLKKRTDRQLRDTRQIKRQKKSFLTKVTRQKEQREGVLAELERSAERVDSLLKELEARRRAAIVVPGPGVDGTYIERKGIEIRTGEGSDIRAVMEGTVVYGDWLRGYGLVLILDHGNGFFSLYAHASKLLTEVGARVQAGQAIGETGDTGLIGDTTLYFELRDGSEPVDPLLWLARRP